MADEFELIERYFRTPDAPGDGVWLGVGDDAAVLDIPPGCTVVDEMAIHPIADAEDAFAFGTFVLGDALARLRSKGANPRWFTLALTLPEVHPEWLEGLSRAVRHTERSHGVRLVGGDTTRGPGALAVCVFAVLAEGASDRDDSADDSSRDASEDE